MKIRTYIFLLVIWAACLYLASSCATTEEPEVVYDPACTTRIELRNGTKFEVPEDSDNLINAEYGCIRHYGDRSCLVRFIKTGKLSYYAICKRDK